MLHRDGLGRAREGAQGLAHLGQVRRNALYLGVAHDAIHDALELADGAGNGGGDVLDNLLREHDP